MGARKGSIDPNSRQGRLKLMKVGDMIAFPVEDYTSVKAMVGRSFVWGAKYSTHWNAQNKTLEVTRVV